MLSTDSYVHVRISTECACERTVRTCELPWALSTKVGLAFVVCEGGCFYPAGECIFNRNNGGKIPWLCIFRTLSFLFCIRRPMPLVTILWLDAFLNNFWQCSNKNSKRCFWHHALATKHGWTSGGNAIATAGPNSTPMVFLDRPLCGAGNFMQHEMLGFF